MTITTETRELDTSRTRKRGFSRGDLRKRGRKKSRGDRRTPGMEKRTDKKPRGRTERPENIRRLIASNKKKSR